MKNKQIKKTNMFYRDALREKAQRDIYKYHLHIVKKYKYALYASLAVNILLIGYLCKLAL